MMNQTKQRDRYFPFPQTTELKFGSEWKLFLGIIPAFSLILVELNVMYK